MSHHTRNLVIAAIAVAAGVTLDLTAAQTPPADFSSLTTKLETAALAGDATVLKDTRLALLRMLAGNLPQNQVPIVRYTVAYADMRLAWIPAVPPQEQAAMLDDAETQLEEVIKTNRTYAEAYGLLSSVLGAKIAKNPELGMTLGMRSGDMLSQGLALEPNNPRLLVTRGMSQLNTPPEYGGSVKDAEATLRRALQLFAAEPAGRVWPNWGRFDAHTGLGQVLAARGDKAGARAEYDKALVIAPNSGYVLYVLLPAVR